MWLGVFTHAVVIAQLIVRLFVLSAGACVAWQHVMDQKRLHTQDPRVIIVVAQVESEARNPYTALKRRYATLQRNALHVQNALVRSCAQAD